MSAELLQTTSFRFTPFYILRSFLTTAVVNTLIAAILDAIGFGPGFTGTLIFSQCIGLSIHAANLAVIPVYRRASTLSAQVAIIVASVVIGALVGTLIGAWANGIPPGLFLREHTSFFGRVLLIALMFGALISYIFISLSVISEEKVRRLESEKTAMEAELRLLQSQMEPHFLFNTLSNVLGLIESDPDRARRMLESFTLFLRSSIATARERTVTLEQELGVVRSYLDIFSVRMGERLNCRIDAPEGLLACRIPPLTVQPLVENAIKHGLEPLVRGGEIAIRAEQSGDSIRISVVDTGRGIGEKTSGSGIGIENIQKRLALLYGSRGRLLFEENKPSGVMVTIEIPNEPGNGNGTQMNADKRG